MAMFIGYCSEIFIILSTYVTFFLVIAALLPLPWSITAIDDDGTGLLSAVGALCFTWDLTILLTAEEEKLVQLERIP